MRLAIDSLGVEAGQGAKLDVLLTAMLVVLGAALVILSCCWFRGHRV
jgi:hypothetical protein